MNAAAAGKMAKAPATIAIMPPITQPAPILKLSGISESELAAQNVGATKNMKMPPKTKQTRATRFKMPANFSKALIFKSGKTTPAKTMIIPTKIKIQPIKAKADGFVTTSPKIVDSVLPKIAVVPAVTT